ncbi:hypothetical protein KBZ20_16390 [Vulcanococcus limneticus Candia 3F8]|uniref:hypothetical protein n=1 Tax=Vulcanococcus limneticus TaxID=2170428 RepID=UPI0020CB837A|nr:hypothetical protein [Vulcanococcus limneticus]MCP9793328.1 hypothetical protein [Vulcanococcus limneticus MW73D5]MCP9895346.1 hypothetical protein [Vulcanococcus limneticus Candia 3F8]MCP9898742.1 hypothetical protein [Vulcanococcus limneticus Candia 3B3]
MSKFWIAAVPLSMAILPALPVEASPIPLADCYIVSELVSGSPSAERMVDICRNTNAQTQALYDLRCTKASKAARARVDEEVAAATRSLTYTPRAIAQIMVTERDKLMASSQQLIQAQIDANKALQSSILLTMGGQAQASARVSSAADQRLLEAKSEDSRVALEHQQLKERIGGLYLKEQAEARLVQIAAIGRHCR